MPLRRALPAVKIDDSQLLLNSLFFRGECDSSFPIPNLVDRWGERNHCTGLVILLPLTRKKDASFVLGVRFPFGLNKKWVNQLNSRRSISFWVGRAVNSYQAFQVSSPLPMQLARLVVQLLIGMQPQVFSLLSSQAPGRKASKGTIEQH